ncbi:MAG: hypothetical protein E6H78_15660 [Betaproteobacteria bacterium]|nr:MAG: hypothetical protein E6H78_15660 [Betaproteobacteria bacterium]
MSVRFADKTTVRRRVLMLESLRMLVNHELSMHTECYGVHVRRIFVTEPDASGCNWRAEWPVVRAAYIEPCRSQLRQVIDQLRERYNVEQ